MNKKECYKGVFDGVDFELVKWGNCNGSGDDYICTDYSPIWCLYLIIHIDRIPKKNNPKSFILPEGMYMIGKRKHKIHDYYKRFEDIEFHGGITFYEILDKKTIKIGCDYAHFDDHHSMYSWESLYKDVKVAIESFRKMVPDYKFWCCGNGKLYNRRKGIIRNDSFYSREYWFAEHPEWFQEGGIA